MQHYALVFQEDFEYDTGQSWFDKTVHKVVAELDHPDPDRNIGELSNLLNKHQKRRQQKMENEVFSDQSEDYLNHHFNLMIG